MSNVTKGELRTFSLSELIEMRRRFINGERCPWNPEDMDEVIRVKRAEGARVP